MSLTRTFLLFLLVFLLIGVLVILIPVCLTAQEAVAGAIPGTGVALVHPATGLGYAGTSDGRRPAIDLAPGDHSARATLQEISPENTPQLCADVGGTAELEFRLKVAGAQPT